MDDEEGMRDMLRWYLGGSGFDIATASDGEEALAVVARGGVDLIVTDLTMPRLGGFKLLEALSRDEKRPAAIVITGFGTVEMAVSAMRRGASDFLLKPFDPQHLIARIKEILV
ncbi:MAG: response regulator [Elusimicrobia bacterium]|nr:response regulator [Elusimicrobiota bacterium]